MKKRVIKVIFISASLIAAGCAYAFLNTRFGFSIPCVFNKLTGFQCPGCGVTRMCLSILQSDFKSAFEYNPVVLCMIPAGLVLMFNVARRYINTGVCKTSKTENIIMHIMVVILVSFGLFRNIV